MLGVIFSNGLRVIKQVWDWLQSTKESAITDWRKDYLDLGILKGKLNEFDIIVGTNNTPLTPSVTIRTGVAYDGNQERIYVSDETTAYNSANPSHTTDNGLGVLVSTPRSTGSLNIPLTVNVNNYLWVEYLATIDDSVFSLHKETGAKLFYKQTDGYYIKVTTTSTPPTSLSLLLGNVDLTGGGVVSSLTISKAGRSLAGTSIGRVKAVTPLSDKSNVTSSYSYNQTIFFDEHTKAIGTGTVTAANPHGLGPADIGLSETTNIETHQKFLHSNGIVGNSASTTSSLYGFVTVVSPGFDFITYKPLISSEEAVVDGVTITSNDVAVDTIVNFNSLDPSGTWYIYLDKTSKTILKTQTNLISSPDNTKLLLSTVTYTYPGTGGPSDGDLSSFVDRRVFGNIATREIQNSAVTADKLSSSVAGNGLSGGGGAALAINVDNSTIEINSDTLRVKGGGITTTELSSSVVTQLGQNIGLVTRATATAPSGTNTHVDVVNYTGQGRLDKVLFQRTSGSNIPYVNIIIDGVDYGDVGGDGTIKAVINNTGLSTTMFTSSTDTTQNLFVLFKTSLRVRVRNEVTSPGMTSVAVVQYSRQA